MSWGIIWMLPPIFRFHAGGPATGLAFKYQDRVCVELVFWVITGMSGAPAITWLFFWKIRLHSHRAPDRSASEELAKYWAELFSPFSVNLNLKLAPGYRHVVWRKNDYRKWRTGLQPGICFLSPRASEWGLTKFFIWPWCFLLRRKGLAPYSYEAIAIVWILFRCCAGWGWRDWDIFCFLCFLSFL